MRQENEAIHKFPGGISYLNGKIVYTGVSHLAAGQAHFLLII